MARGKASLVSGRINDEDGSRNVPVGVREPQAIPDLTADGFLWEGSAKYLGQEAIVRRIFNPGEPRPRIKVGSIEAINDTCGPEQRL